MSEYNYLEVLRTLMILPRGIFYFRDLKSVYSYFLSVHTRV